ncbi:hypothetical protein M406DRAFT_322558 [Cryphonectria parasitica EP155]|uniref:Hemerythrin-like domain-containing protein n=1 Tax=Cryphonectria parasitica (strain ATCC 38755 / EP155) TaxID=660469 RepID=A0A9P4Y0G8_CRYP1|nr:uncharacterized protein M406DRAFT_322558 [Cryphonectria parasitica EP155]KAF3764291.1 hypothetical protein M406DRAFT_322558 [Cryphonectria parasitica EP155]
MPSSSALSTSVFLGIISLVLALLAQRSPFMMASTPASSSSKPWADGPMKLVGTPIHETNKTDIFSTGASHMALLHNSIFRGYNSIYLQAPHVQDADKADFVGYCLTWFKFVKSHHDDEEETLFTKVEELLGDTSVFEETHKEHQSFMAGLVEFNTYLTSLPTPQALDGAKLLAIMDSFSQPFETHFHNEIATIARLADHPAAPKPDTPEAAEASLTFKSWGKSTVTKAGTTDVVPFFLLNLDRTPLFEDGRWASWPPIPAPIKWGLINVGGWFKGGYWKFASCDSAGNRRELYALPDGAKA